MGSSSDKSMLSKIDAALEPSDHTVTLRTDGSLQTYHLRSLQITTSSEEKGQECNTDDIKRWTNFCASVFSYKANPPPASYFSRHFYNDPRRDAALVRVLIHCPNGSDEERQQGEIVSSVRIFRRTLTSGSSDSGTIEAGGIGEVCTSPNHQRRGLSKILLKDAINIMSCSSNEEGGMSCSLLHASPDFQPVYAKVGGYKSVKSEWSVVPIKLQHLINKRQSDANDDGWQIRQAKFPDDASQLQQLHAEYSEKRLITIQRSLQYWNEYVSAELGDTLWVMHDDDGTILAWISIRKRGDRYQLREFGVTKDTNSAVVPTTFFAMQHLLGVALDQAGEIIGDGSEVEKEVVPFVLPTFVLSEMKQDIMATGNNGDESLFLNVDMATEENDDGWMYVNFDHQLRHDVLQLTTRDMDPIPHLIWPTDSF